VKRRGIRGKVGTGAGPRKEILTGGISKETNRKTSRASQVRIRSVTLIGWAQNGQKRGEGGRSKTGGLGKHRGTQSVKKTAKKKKVKSDREWPNRFDGGTLNECKRFGEERIRHKSPKASKKRIINETKRGGRAEGNWKKIDHRFYELLNNYKKKRNQK